MDFESKFRNSSYRWCSTVRIYYRRHYYRLRDWKFEIRVIPEFELIIVDITVDFEIKILKFESFKIPKLQIIIVNIIDFEIKSLKFESFKIPEFEIIIADIIIDFEIECLKFE